MVAWCISLLCGRLEQLKGDDPAMVQHHTRPLDPALVKKDGDMS